MTTVSGTFTADAVSSTLRLGRAAEEVDFAVTGPLDATVVLERALTPAGTAWEVVAGPFTSDAAGRYSGRRNDRLRMRSKDTAVLTVTNGDFAAATGWTAGAGWAIATGVATRTASASTPNLDTTIAAGLVEGASYTVTFDMTTSAGTMTVSLGGGDASDAQNEADGSVSVTLVAGATAVLRFIADASYAGTLDNVTITPAIAYTFNDVDVVLETVWDPDGNVLETGRQSGRTVHGNLTVEGAATLTGAVGAVNIDAGSSGAAGTVDVFPATAAKGKLAITAADSAGDTTTTIVNASQAAARTYTIPDAGAAASFVMTEGAQTVNGVKTFGSVPVLPAGGLTTGSTTITEAELGVLDTVTPGTAAASKALTLDANSKLDGLPLVKRSLTALSLVNLQALAATPIQVIAAPGAGKFIQVLGWRFRLIFGTVAIDDAAADGDLTLKYAGGSTIDTMQADGLVDAAATTQGLSGNLTELIVAETGIDNTAVQISNDGAEFTIVGGGSGTAEVEVFYRILDTNPA